MIDAIIGIFGIILFIYMVLAISYFAKKLADIENKIIEMLAEKKD